MGATDRRQGLGGDWVIRGAVNAAVDSRRCDRRLITTHDDSEHRFPISKLHTKSRVLFSHRQDAKVSQQDRRYGFQAVVESLKFVERRLG